MNSPKDCDLHKKLHDFIHEGCSEDDFYGVICEYVCKNCDDRFTIPAANIRHFVHGAETHEEMNLEKA